MQTVLTDVLVGKLKVLFSSFFLLFLGAVKSISETGLYTTFRRFGGSQPHGSEVQATFLANLVWVQKAMLNV